MATWKHQDMINSTLLPRYEDGDEWIAPQDRIRTDAGEVITKCTGIVDRQLKSHYDFKELRKSCKTA